MRKAGKFRLQNILIVTVGKLSETWWQQAAAEYLKRLAGYCKINLVEIAEHRLPRDPSPAQIEEGLAVEGEKILDCIPKGSFVVPMCIEGKTISSEALSQRISELGVQGRNHITFIIGGSFGLWEKVKLRGDLRLSVSPMTFPHQLARVMLLEQLYRAFAINSGSKYHK